LQTRIATDQNGDIHYLEEKAHHIRRELRRIWRRQLLLWHTVERGVNNAIGTVPKGPDGEPGA
jgi:hypothetical protein